MVFNPIINKISEYYTVAPAQCLSLSDQTRTTKQRRCIILVLFTRQAWADDTSLKVHKMYKNFKIIELHYSFLDSPREMHSNNYKHAWYWFRNSWNFENFEKQTDFVWMGKLMAACKVLRSVDHWETQIRRAFPPFFWRSLVSMLREYSMEIPSFNMGALQMPWVMTAISRYTELTPWVLQFYSLRLLMFSTILICWDCYGINLDLTEYIARSGVARPGVYD